MSNRAVSWPPTLFSLYLAAVLKVIIRCTDCKYLGSKLVNYITDIENYNIHNHLLTLLVIPTFTFFTELLTHEVRMEQIERSIKEWQREEQRTVSIGPEMDHEVET